MTAKVQERTPAERFWANVDKSGDCWLWTGYVKPNGYASFYPGGGRHVPKVYAHRFSYGLHKGLIPLGMEIDHTCNTRHCVNPDHLEVVGHRENLERAKARRTHCKNGHSLADAYITTGNRVCRSCRLNAQRVYRAQQQGV